MTQCAYQPSECSKLNYQGITIHPQLTQKNTILEQNLLQQSVRYPKKQCDSKKVFY
ncbi:unnamed protein product [Paramecium octaurelia]|uniref:Uncharacterized protein n=1 Tax=Paramecium octaurelia TaxID=43137 RepID=A0A8S1W8I5_PAROT|nr:unnamed protein product [Paramecium octaurelia]